LKILIVRHAVAEDRAEYHQDGGQDSLRPLTKQGVDRFKCTALKIKEILGDSIGTIYTSELVRSLSTAEILAGFVPEGQIVQTKLLNPGFQPKELQDFIKTIHHKKKIPCFVGHEPDLSHFIGDLVCQKSVPIVRLKKGGAVLIDFTPPQSQILWYLTYALSKK
jgi:phosphohistidine phosphatase